MESPHGRHNAGGPVEIRANLMAASIASVPELQKKTFSSPARVSPFFVPVLPLIVVKTLEQVISFVACSAAPQLLWDAHAPGLPLHVLNCNPGTRLRRLSHSEAPCRARR